MKRSLLSGSMKVAGLLAVAGLASLAVPVTATDDPYAGLPATIDVNGVIRDFRANHVRGGHPDMEMTPPMGYALYNGVVSNDLDNEAKPNYASSGFKVTTQATDSSGRPIIGPKPYIQAMTGDNDPHILTQQGQVVTSSGRFNQWFRDVPGVNTSRAFGIYLARQPGTNRYVFDGDIAGHGRPNSGGFTVNGQHTADALGGNPNYDITYESSLNFRFRSGHGQYFLCAGDDDMWVFIDNKLVVDLGGMHSATWQRIDLDRLSWLSDNQQYTAKVFFAERHMTASRFYLEVNMQLEAVPLPPTSGLAD